MGLGTDRRGIESLAYPIDARFRDKWFIEMFRQGANMNTYYCTKGALVLENLAPGRYVILRKTAQPAAASTAALLRVP